MNQDDQLIFDNIYTYDDVDNITQIKNNRIPEPWRMGGGMSHDFTYDPLYRLIHAEGTYNGYLREETYDLTMSYGDAHQIVTKNLTHNRNDEAVEKTTYDNSYKYDAIKPHAPDTVGNRTYTYDRNGNSEGWENTNNVFQEVFWDEENR